MRSSNKRAQRQRDKLKDATQDLLTPEERAAEPPDVDTDDPVDEAGMDSFPASDPPSFTPTRAGRASPDPVDERP